MLARPKTADSSTMWLVTSAGDLPDDFEQRDHQAAADAWSDYWGRILELESAASGITAKKPPSMGGCGRPLCSAASSG
jgi:hypothetical protein